MATLLPSEANKIVQRISKGEVRVEADDDEVCLVFPAADERVRLLRYQMTEEGVETALAEFVLWSRLRRGEAVRV